MIHQSRRLSPYSIFAADAAHTAVAHLACVRRVHQHQGDARAYTLVGQEQAQLMEGPAVRPSPFRLGPRLPRGPLADARQIFQGDRPPRRDSPIDDALADGVIDLRLKAMFAPRQPCQSLPPASAAAPCAFRDVALDHPACACVAIPDRRHLLPAERVAVAGHGDSGPAQVNANYAVGVNGGRIGVDGADHEPPASLAVAHQIGLFERGGPFQPLPLYAADVQFDAQPTVERR